VERDEAAAAAVQYTPTLGRDHTYADMLTSPSEADCASSSGWTRLLHSRGVEDHAFAVATACTHAIGNHACIPLNAAPCVRPLPLTVRTFYAVTTLKAMCFVTVRAIAFYPGSNHKLCH
jgi:hypothetical protein